MALNVQFIIIQSFVLTETLVLSFPTVAYEKPENRCPVWSAQLLMTKMTALAMSLLESGILSMQYKQKGSCHQCLGQRWLKDKMLFFRMPCSAQHGGGSMPYQLGHSKASFPSRIFHHFLLGKASDEDG